MTYLETRQSGLFSSCLLLFFSFLCFFLSFFSLVTFARRILTVSSRYCNASITETLVDMAPDTSDVGGKSLYSKQKVLVPVQCCFTSTNTVRTGDSSVVRAPDS